MSKKEIVLELSTQQPEPVFVTIDKVEYQLTDPEGMEVKDYLWSMGATKRLFAMYGTDLSDEDATYVDEVLDRVVRIYLPTLPDEVFDSLSDMHKFAVLNAFYEAVGSRLREASRSDSTKSSPESDDSTKEPTPTGGASP